MNASLILRFVVKVSLSTSNLGESHMDGNLSDTLPCYHSFFIDVYVFCFLVEKSSSITQFFI